MTSPANVQATYCATLVDEWVRAGVAHAVLAPGSRSTPLALALAADGRLAVHVHHDERVAAFVALGIGRATEIPAVVLTTSGTAVAHLHPAVIEASYAGVPMLVCTADRPPELQSVGAPQTIDQAHLFGRAVRWFAEPGVADAAVAPTWRSLASRAFAEAVGLRPGPVHLNLAFREPLVGEAGPLPPGREGGAPWHRVSSPAQEVDERWSEPLSTVRRGVLVAGGGVGHPAPVHELAERLAWPILADPRSGARSPGTNAVAAFDALLRDTSFAEAHRPDLVVRLGQAPASKVLEQWIQASGAEQLVVTEAWLDPGRAAHAVLRARPDHWCRAMVAELGGGRDDAWCRSWLDADARAQAAIEATLAAHHEATEPHVARTVAASAGTLVVASSMPVRDVEWYSARHADRCVHVNRGANGIDGVLSTAIGVALGTGEPVTALLGDVALLHDSNALLGLADRGLDLTVVVVDNRGGGIFSFLPQATALPADRYELLFGTPHAVDLAALAAVHGIPAVTVERAAELGPALAGSGTRLVVVRTDRAANVAVHDELHAAVAAAL